MSLWNSTEEVAVDIEMDNILTDPEVMADVLYAADIEELQDLAGVLCDLVTSNKVNWDLQHAKAIRQAVNEFVEAAATVAVNYEEKCNE